MEKIEKFQLLLSCSIIALGILISSVIFASRIQKNENITVTGSASKIVKSDSAKLHFEIQSKAINQKDAYNLLKAQNPIVLKYLEAKGIEKNDIDIRSINGYYNYKMNSNGYSTNEVASYSANQGFDIKSKDVEKIKEISLDIQSLVDINLRNYKIYSSKYILYENNKKGKELIYL